MGAPTVSSPTCMCMLLVTQVDAAQMMLLCDTSLQHKAPTVRFGPIQFNLIRYDPARAKPNRADPARSDSIHPIPNPIQSAHTHTHILQDTTKAHTYTTICLTITTWRPPPASSCLLALTEHLPASLSAYLLAYLPAARLPHACSPLSEQAGRQASQQADE